MSETVIRAEGLGKKFVIGHRVQNNGLFAILGMTRAEVRHRFDEIVAFAGAEKFIDSINIDTCFTNVHTDHRVENAVRFVVDQCTPGSGSFNFRQSLATGSLAMTLTRPIEFKPLTVDTTG